MGRRRCGSRPRPRAPTTTWASGGWTRSACGWSRICSSTASSWSHTERLSYAQGDSVHWRVVNFTELDHPMHLHGFYFRTESKGNGVTDSLYTPEQRRMGVTE